MINLSVYLSVPLRDCSAGFPRRALLKRKHHAHAQMLFLSAEIGYGFTTVVGVVVVVAVVVVEVVEVVDIEVVIVIV